MLPTIRVFGYRVAFDPIGIAVWSRMLNILAKTKQFIELVCQFVELLFGNLTNKVSEVGVCSTQFEDMHTRFLSDVARLLHSYYATNIYLSKFKAKNNPLTH